MSAIAGPLPPHLADPRLTPLSTEEFDAFRLASQRGFQEEKPPETLPIDQRITDLPRFFGFTVDGRWVSTFGSFARSLTVPGGMAVSTSAISEVTVHTAYRRRGLLRRAMVEEFARCQRRGEPIATLFASEGGIYGRFGFGSGQLRASLSGQLAAIRFRPEIEAQLAAAGGSVDEVDRAEFLRLAGPLHDRLLPERPGNLDRTDAWWDVKILDPAAWRDGATAYRYVLSYAADGTVDGQAVYSFKADYADGNPRSTVNLVEVEGATAIAEARLWRYLSGIDLATEFSLRMAPVEHRLRYMVMNPRAIVTRSTDWLAVRLIDAAAALAARRYAAPVDTVIEVVDDMLPEAAGRYRVRGDLDGAEAERTDREPELTLTARDLGAIYLGGVSLGSLHHAGLVAERRPGAVARASAGFGWPIAPFCADVF